jgi:hypothetical protein
LLNNFGNIQDEERLDLSIVIVNWNAGKFLDRCLASIYKNLSRPAFEVIVVDNNSSDDSVKMVKEKYPQVELIENEMNCGFARANNQAIEKSRARYVLILGSDTTVFPGTIEKLIEFMDGRKEVGAVSPRILNLDGSVQSLGRDLPNLTNTFLQYFLPYKFYRIVQNFLRKKNEEIFEVDGLSGSAMLIKKETLLSVGLFDEQMPLYAEDIDLCYRIKKAGWNMWCCPNVSITHMGGGSTGLVPIESKVKAYQAPYVYFSKHYGGKTALLVRTMIGVSSIIRMMVWLMLYCLKEKRRNTAINKFRSYKVLLSWAMGDDDASCKST